jgi:hypothetical protein
MVARKSPSYAAILVAAALLACTRPATPQTFDIESDRVQMAELKGLWRFRTGDDPRWANPSFDDSSWPLLRSDSDWGSQGFKGYAGSAWYRFKVIVPANHPPLAIFVPPLVSSYQIFVNARMIGHFGGMPPNPVALQPETPGAIFSVPDELVSAGQPLCVAIRVWSWRYYALFGEGGPYAPLRVGDATVLTEWNSLQHREFYWLSSSVNFLLFLEALAALASFGLFSLRPAEREYLWFGVFELFSALTLGVGFLPISISFSYQLQVLFSAVDNIAFLLFVMEVLRERRGWLFWIGVGSNVFCVFVATVGMGWEWIGLATLIAALGAAFLPYAASILALLMRGARRGNLDAHLLLYPAGIDYTVNVFALASMAMYFSGAVRHDWYYHLSSELIRRPFPISLQNLGDFLQQLGIFAIVVLRFARSRHDEQRMAGELESARAVQHVLIPQQIPRVPGFLVECAYKPAGEVGGDFFQIIPLSRDGALIAIGDVSGKGMPAAMTVSLLVGTLRTLAHYTQRPGEILASMNQRMIGRADGGFTTCLVLRIGPDGGGVLANAGHLAPYIDGKEIALSSGLPLGLDASSIYPEVSFQLTAKSQLTLLTDGVAEARNRSGELFGFDRTASIASSSAESIALAAQQFGQNDDITVLTVTSEPDAEATAAFAAARTSLPA